MPSEVFLDTAVAPASANRNDLLHPRAKLLADRLEADRTRIVTSRAVILGDQPGTSRLRMPIVL
ncbi:MAG: hypothetical protein V2B18_06215 [Pseudomonadota bacterium]